VRAVVRLPIVALAVFTAGVFPFEAGLVVTKAMIPAASITGRTKPHMYRRRGDFACAGAGFDFRFGGAGGAGGAGAAAAGTVGPAGAVGAGDGAHKSAAYADTGAEGAVAARGSPGAGNGTDTIACAGLGAGSGIGIGSATSPDDRSGDSVGVGIGVHRGAVNAGEGA